MSLTGKNLLDGPGPTYLPKEPVLEIRLGVGEQAADLVRDFPQSSLVWALLAQQALQAGKTIEGYAYARVGYHRGLDALRAAGWKGHGPIPFSHQPNRGFLQALYLLGVAATALGEETEAQRIEDFLKDADPEAKEQLAQ